MPSLSINHFEKMQLQEMQDDHEQEIIILNKINDLINAYYEKKSLQPELEAELEKYIMHVKEHFEREEELMEEYDFPYIDMHEMAHQMFTADMNYAVLQWKRNGNLDNIIEFIKKAPEWIEMHLDAVDAPTAKYLVKNGAQE